MLYDYYPLHLLNELFIDFDSCSDASKQHYQPNQFHGPHVVLFHWTV